MYLASLACTNAMTSLASAASLSTLPPQAKQCTFYYCNGYFFIAGARLPSGQFRSHGSHSSHSFLRPEIPSTVPTTPWIWYWHQIGLAWFQPGPPLSILSVLWSVTMKRADGWKCQPPCSNHSSSPGSVELFLSCLSPPPPLNCRCWCALWPSNMPVSLGVREYTFSVVQMLDSCVLPSRAGPVNFSQRKSHSSNWCPLHVLSIPWFRFLCNVSHPLANIHYPLYSRLPFASSARIEAIGRQKTWSSCPSLTVSYALRQCGTQGLSIAHSIHSHGINEWTE